MKRWELWLNIPLLLWLNSKCWIFDLKKKTIIRPEADSKSVVLKLPIYPQNDVFGRGLKKSKLFNIFQTLSEIAGVQACKNDKDAFQVLMG